VVLVDCSFTIASGYGRDTLAASCGFGSFWWVGVIVCECDEMGRVGLFHWVHMGCLSVYLWILFVHGAAMLCGWHDECFG